VASAGSYDVPEGMVKKNKMHARAHNMTQETQKIQTVEQSGEQAELASAENEWAEKYSTQRCSKTLIEERKEKKRFP
jgi:hypothetical protein